MPIPLRPDFDATRLRGLAREARMPSRFTVYQHSRRFTMERRVQRQRRSAA